MAVRARDGGGDRCPEYQTALAAVAGEVIRASSRSRTSDRGIGERVVHRLGGALAVRRLTARRGVGALAAGAAPPAGRCALAGIQVWWGSPSWAGQDAFVDTEDSVSSSCSTQGTRSTTRCFALVARFLRGGLGDRVHGELRQAGVQPKRRRSVSEILRAMSPARKRTVRLVVALTAAMVLAGALIYTSFSAASPTVTPTQLMREAQPGISYLLTGTVVDGSIKRSGEVLNFRVADRAGGGASVAVAYTGTVPDPFREGREIIVTVQKQGQAYAGERNSLITKCPSKYQVAPPGENQNS